MTLKDKIAFITGGSQGIGRACAMVLAEAGADIAIGSRSIERLNSVVSELESLGRIALATKLDVCDSHQVHSAFEAVVQRFGRVDILINNAGITKDMLLLRMKKEDWDSVLQTNLTGVFLCSQEAIKVMLKQKYGRIINISSVVACWGIPVKLTMPLPKRASLGSPSLWRLKWLPGTSQLMRSPPDSLRQR